MNENGMENRVLEALRREGRPLAPETVFEAFEAEERDAVASAVEQLLGSDADCHPRASKYRRDV